MMLIRLLSAFMHLTFYDCNVIIDIIDVTMTEIECWDSYGEILKNLDFACD